jgi:hypothetical protein
VRYPGSVLLSQVFFRARAHQADATSLCFAATSENAQNCANRTGFTNITTSPGSVGDGYASTFAAAYGEEWPKADVDALLQTVDVDSPTLAEWLVVAL